MDRIIKFRCWNGETMISPDYINRDGTAFWKENSIPTMSKELMQFTNLTDKNGVEIYRSDVIKAKLSGNVGTRDSREIIGVIIYKKGCYFISEDGIEPHTHLMYIYDIEVLGNIHQHVHLLNLPK